MTRKCDSEGYFVGSEHTAVCYGVTGGDPLFAASQVFCCPGVAPMPVQASN